MEVLDDLANYVASARVLSDWAFDKHGAHQSYLLVLEGGVGVLAKPEDEIQNVGSVLVRREVAAWIVARLLGWPDLIAVTVLRQLRSFKTGTQVAASLQVLWPFPEWLPAVTTLPDDDVWQAAVFDAVVHHSDRSNNNWLGVPGAGRGAQARLRLCDHGYGFEPGLAAPSSDFYRAKLGEALPTGVVAALKSLHSGLPGALQGLLPDPELAGVWRPGAYRIPFEQERASVSVTLEVYDLRHKGNPPMAVHIDVVENDWLGGRQTVVARLSVQDGTYRVESQDPTRWLRVLGLPENPPDLRDEGRALEFLSNIAHKLRGTYVFATEPHPDEKCEFPEGYALLKAARNPVGEAVETQATAPAIARRA